MSSLDEPETCVVDRRQSVGIKKLGRFPGRCDPAILEGDARQSDEATVLLRSWVTATIVMPFSSCS